MAVAVVTKGPLSYADDATLKIGMDNPDHPSTEDPRPADPLNALNENVTDEERLRRIARLKQAVADGTYHVSAEQLADKLIEHMLEPKG
jgi:Anti-sigma-28 factor, FlgM